ncbi:hypothetical protein FOA52_010242 [Chlamydomonas sp. UWO 241]|nr:hypothetical protein FOA52_010242 [Chlamydomonas sp. UWO 241]
MLANLCQCFLGPTHRGRAREYARGDDSAGQDLASADNPEYLATLISLCSFGDTNQKVQAAHRIALISRSGPRASERRRVLLSMDVLGPLVLCMGAPDALVQPSERLRAAAAQALCNLALECREAERREALPGAPLEQQTSVLYREAEKLVPPLLHLMKGNGGESAVIAAQALSNLMLGSAFVPKVLASCGPLPDTATRLAQRSHPAVRELFSQALLNAALHSGRASFLDQARAPEALLTLLDHHDTPPVANERCLCTLYNMIFGEEASPRRAADMLALPRAAAALCRQLLRPQPNCRFLAACLIMRMLHAAADAMPDGEWGDEGDDEAGGASRQFRHRRDTSAYRRVVASLSCPQLAQAVQHALSSCVISSAGFTYGQRPHLLQALVSALHALCAMQELPASEAASAGDDATPSPSEGGMSQGGSPAEAEQQQQQQHPGASTTSTTAQPSPSGPPPPLLLQITRDSVDKLCLLLSGGGGGGGAGGAAGHPDPSVAEACLCLLSLMTTARGSTAILVQGSGVVTALTAVLTSHIGPRPGGASGRGGGGGGGGGSESTTPRRADGSRAHAALRQAASLPQYLSADGPASGGPDDALAWGRCHVLAAKALRNLCVCQPGALLRLEASRPCVLPALLVCVYYPGRLPTRAGPGSSCGNHTSHGGHSMSAVGASRGGGAAASASSTTAAAGGGGGTAPGNEWDPAWQAPFWARERTRT